MDKLKIFLKNWMLPIAMLCGIMGYVVYAAIPALAPAGPYLYNIVSFLQPSLLFLILFLAFCNISPKDLRPRKWHLKLILFQVFGFVALALLEIFLPDFEGAVLLESAMIMLICPTATAAAVVTGKLGGDMPGLTSYLVIMNLVAAVLVPLVVPFVHPVDGLNFLTAFCMILAKIFPLLILPFLLAWIVRYLMPKLHRRILRYPDAAFYVWGFNLMFAVLMTVRSIYHSDVAAVYQVGIALVSLLCCILEFAMGRRIGARYGDATTAGQALGQKNTVFAIWMGYTFMTPVTAIAGGFYSIWHNLYNSWQLYRYKGK